ncbi:MAG: hypothetical protein V3U75_00785 [Methylococcaceae bacterium]
MTCRAIKIHEIIILAFISLTLIAAAGALLMLQNQHQESKELTRESIYKFKLKADSLTTNDELREYIDYLSNGIVNFRKDSESYVDGLFDDIYRPLMYLLFFISISQMLVIISLLRREWRKGAG